MPEQEERDRKLGQQMEKGAISMANSPPTGPNHLIGVLRRIGISEVRQDVNPIMLGTLKVLTNIAGQVLGFDEEQIQEQVEEGKKIARMQK